MQFIKRLRPFPMNLSRPVSNKKHPHPGPLLREVSGGEGVAPPIPLPGVCATGASPALSPLKCSGGESVKPAMASGSFVRGASRFRRDAENCDRSFQTGTRSPRRKGNSSVQLWGRVFGVCFAGFVSSLCVLMLASCQTQPAAQASLGLLDPDAPVVNRRAPEDFRVRMDTSKGAMVIEVHRDWSPHGADRFYNLVRAGYYDDSYFFRVIRGRWAQFGINGDTNVPAAWRTRTFPDDPRKVSNTRGTIAFAFAVPNGRTTEVFINLRDNSSTHDAEPFVPFGEVVEGMDVVDALNTEYGESSGGGIRAGKQGPLFALGNAPAGEISATGLHQGRQDRGIRRKVCALERFNKYCSRSAGKRRAVFLASGFVFARLQPHWRGWSFRTGTTRSASPGSQKSSLRTATLFLKTL